MHCYLECMHAAQPATAMLLTRGLHMHRLADATDCTLPLLLRRGLHTFSRAAGVILQA
jgi:hypothetical protein